MSSYNDQAGRFIDATPDQLRQLIELVDKVPEADVDYVLDWIRTGSNLYPIDQRTGVEWLIVTLESIAKVQP